MPGRKTRRVKVAQKLANSPLRVLSYNIHQGLTVHKKKIALAVLKEAIKSLKADIVLLQEVAGTRHPRRKDGHDETELTPFQLEALADSLWPYQAYGRNSVFSGGFHGNAILSRYPILRSMNHDISVKRLVKRGILHGIIRLPGSEKSLHLLATHLGLFQYERQIQVRWLCEFIDKTVGADEPLILAGDFNDWRERVSKKLSKKVGLTEAFLEKHSSHARTFPAQFPLLRLDRIYFRGLDLHSVTKVRGRPWQLLSDHLPLMAEFELNKE